MYLLSSSLDLKRVHEKVNIQFITFKNINIKI